MAEMNCTCPHCSQELAADTDYAGQAMSCPHCNGEFTVPDAPASKQLVVPPVAPPPQQAPPQQQYAAQPSQGYAPPPQGYGQQPPQGYAPPQQGYAAQQPGYGAPGQPIPYQGPRAGIGALFSDPLESQPKIIGSIGASGAGRWGWMFAGLYVVISWLFSWRSGSGLLDAMPGVGGSGRAFRQKEDIEFMQHLEWILSAAVPLVVLVLVFLLLMTMVGRPNSFGAILFTASVVALPMAGFALYMLAVSFLEIKSAGAAKVIGHITIILMALCLTSLILLIKASLVSVIGYTRKAAFWLVPSVMLAVGYISNWIGELVGEIAK